MNDSLKQRCRCFSYSVVAVSQSVIVAVYRTALWPFPVFLLFLSNPETCLEEQSDEFSLRIDYWDKYVKASVTVPVFKDEMKYTMSNNCLNETVLFQSLVTYISAKEQFVLWPCIPTALRERVVHSYRDLPTSGGHLASNATLIKPETVLRRPHMSKDGTKQFDAICRANIA